MVRVCGSLNRGGGASILNTPFFRIFQVFSGKNGSKTVKNPTWHIIGGLSKAIFCSLFNLSWLETSDRKASQLESQGVSVFELSFFFFLMITCHFCLPLLLLAGGSRSSCNRLISVTRAHFVTLLQSNQQPTLASAADACGASVVGGRANAAARRLCCTGHRAGCGCY